MSARQKAIADQRTMQLLEYDKIIQLVQNRAESEPGRLWLENLRPQSERSTVLELLDQTAEAEHLLRQGRAPSIGPLKVVASLTDAAKRGLVLQGEDLLAVLALARSSRRARQRLLQTDGLKRLHELAETWPILTEIEEKLALAIDEDGDLLDTASPRLAELRHKKQVQESRLRRQLEGLLRRLQPYLQESYITHRNGRAVLPVRQEQRTEVPGVIHDQSASGATLFIEPFSTVPLNNDLRQLEKAEDEEMERIFRQLSQAVGEWDEPIRQTEAGIAELDASLARGRLALDWSAVRPKLLDHPAVDLQAARHPLLGENAVPIDLQLGLNFQALVITGPNTGGKTVSLKTCGLFVLLAQSGMFLPAADGTAIGMFQHVACDIGDEQSIEQSLSTFSSHIHHVIQMLPELGPGSLLLLDELGAGTDPDEGSALAKALLEHIVERGALAVVTSHYRELKSFAHEHPQLMNASVEFDAKSLAPSYRLLIGLPGKSNALAIARRLGMPESILEAARRLQPESEQAVEELLAGLAADRARAESERRTVEAERKLLMAERERTEEERKRLAAARAELRQQAREQLERFADEARARLEKAWREQMEAERDAQRHTLNASGLDRVRSRLGEEKRRLNMPFQAPEDAREAHGMEEAVNSNSTRAAASREKVIEPGVLVRIPHLDQKGVVLETPDAHGQVQVSMGSMRMRLHTNELEVVSQADVSGKKGAHRNRGKQRRAFGDDDRSSEISMRKAEEIDTEIHLRGLRVADALERLDKYIDDALVAGLPQIRIVHGKGTGTMRKVVHEVLDRHPAVARRRLGDIGEGGSGVTVVEFK